MKNAKLYRIITGVAFLQIIALGLNGVRDLIFASHFGVSAEVDQYLKSMTLLNMIISIAQGCIISLVIPVYLECEKKQSLKEADDFFLRVTTQWGGLTFIFLLGCISFSLKMIIPLSFVVFFAVLSHSFRTYLSLKKFFLFGVFATILQFLLTSILFYSIKDSLLVHQFGWIYSLGYFIESCILFIYLYSVNPNLFSFKLKNSFKYVESDGVFWRRSIPLIIAMVTYNGIFLLQNHYATFKGVGVVSIVNYGMKIPQLFITVLSQSFSTVLFTSFSEWWIKDEFTILWREFKKSLFMTVLITFPVVVILFFFGDLIVKIIYERGQWTIENSKECAFFIKSVCIYIPFTIMGQIGVRMLHAQGRSRLLLYNACFTVLLSACCFSFFTKHYGVSGVGMSWTCISFLLFMIVFLEVKFGFKKINQNHGVSV